MRQRLVIGSSIGVQNRPVAAVRREKWGIPPLLRDFQGRWKSPALGLFHRPPFSSASSPTDSAIEPDFVAKNHARKPPHHFEKFKRQVRVCLQASPKISAQRHRTSYRSGGIVQEPGCHRRCQLDLRRIARENGVEIMPFPCAHPIGSKFFDLSFAEHGAFFSPPERFQAPGQGRYELARPQA